MISIRSFAAARPSRPLLAAFLGPARAYSTEKPKKKKTKQATTDISLIPIKTIGVLADFYIPPKFTNSPITSWHRLILRRLGNFGLNTYSVSRFKKETQMKLKFNDWKEEAVDKYVKTNKIFAAACSNPRSQRKLYLETQLESITGTSIIKALTNRANSFPPDAKLEWNLKSIEANPKLVSFTAIPDANDVTSTIQFVVKVKTKQEIILTAEKDKPQATERLVTDYIVMTLNPFTNEMVFVGTIFESDHIRGVQPELELTARTMEAFQNTCADIYRAPPKAIA